MEWTYIMVLEIYVKMRNGNRSISCMVYELIFGSHFYINGDDIFLKPYKNKIFSGKKGAGLTIWKLRVWILE